MVYLADDSIAACALEEGKKHGLRLRSVFREFTQDLAFVVLQSDSWVVVAFRGTVSAPNWLININVMQRDLITGDNPHLLAVVKSRAKLRQARVHGGFQNAYRSVREKLIGKVSIISPSLSFY